MKYRYHIGRDECGSWSDEAYDSRQLAIDAAQKEYDRDCLLEDEYKIFVGHEVDILECCRPDYRHLGEDICEMLDEQSYDRISGLDNDDPIISLPLEDATKLGQVVWEFILAHNSARPGKFIDDIDEVAPVVKA